MEWSCVGRGAYHCEQVSLIEGLGWLEVCCDVGIAMVVVLCELGVDGLLWVPLGAEMGFGNN